jgi:hypothetical protein
VLLEVDLREQRAADVARLAETAVDAVRLPVGRARLAQREPARELRVDRRGKARDLFLVEVGRQRVRRELRRVEDLVRPRAPDPGDQPLVAKESVEAARLAVEDLAEARRIELVGLGA